MFDVGLVCVGFSDNPSECFVESGSKIPTTVHLNSRAKDKAKKQFHSL